MITQFLLSVTFAFFIITSCKKATIAPTTIPSTMLVEKTYLALGDSYTIGESVAEQDRFPAQTVQWLRNNTPYTFAPIKYVAKTGFTCNELAAAIAAENIVAKYDVVSLLIGVNDQYRGYNIAEYKNNLLQLLQQAIAFANNKPSHVFVLSIPDWGVTPFAASRNKQQIAQEINAYNAIKESLAKQMGVNFIPITESTREVTLQPNLVAQDGLHPSAAEYKKWAQLLGPIVKEKVLQ